MNRAVGAPSLQAVGGPEWTALGRSVREVNAQPVDALDVTALLESLGWTDRQAAERFGFPDLFAMGGALQQWLAEMRQVEPPPKPGLRWYALVWRVAVQFPHGLAFALPIIISFAAMLVLHISLSSYLYFDVLQATALALAVFLSFLATGGMVQAMANSVLLFLNMRETALARTTAWRLMRWGMFLAVALAVALVLGDAVIPVLPLQLVLFMDIYLVLLSAMWLAFASLYILRSEYYLTAITAGGILVAFALWRAGLPVVVAQAIALVAAALASVTTAVILLARLARRNPSRSRFVEPRISQLAYIAWPYFLYGTIYFVFIFIDRIVAWSTAGTYMPYYIWFRGQYELGMDWALLTLVLPLAAVEVLVHYVVNWVQSNQQAVPAARTADFVRGLRAVYLHCLGAFAVAAATAVVLTRLVIAWARGVRILASALPTVSVEPFVFHLATASYILLAASLFNILVMFSLGSPWPPLRLIGIAMAIDFLLGLVLTRLTGQYQYAVLGLLFGTGFLTVSSTREILRHVSRIDYLLFRMV